MTVDPMSGTRELYWEITTSCQLACRYCFYETGMSDRVRKQVRADASTRALITNELRPHFGSILFTGGEVLLGSSFWDLVEMAAAAKLCVSFLTDGLRLDTNAIGRLRDSGVSRVAISLDSLSAEMNDRVRLPVAASANRMGDTIISHICELSRQRPPGLEITVLQTVCSANIRAIRPMVRFCRDIGVDLLVHPAGMPSVAALDDIRLEKCHDTEIKELREAMLEWAEGNPNRVGYTHAAIAFIRGERPCGLACPMGATAFFLDVTGNLFPCFHRKDLRLGNVWHESLAQIMARSSNLDLNSAPCADLACSCLLDCGSPAPASDGQGTVARSDSDSYALPGS